MAPTEVRSTINAVLIDPLPAAVRMMALDRSAAPADVAGVPDRGGAAEIGSSRNSGSGYALQQRRWVRQTGKVERVASVMMLAVPSALPVAACYADEIGGRTRDRLERPNF